MLCNFACSFENDYNKIANVNICHQLKTNNTWTISVNVYIWPLLEKKGLNCASLCACVCVSLLEKKKKALPEWESLKVTWRFDLCIAWVVKQNCRVLQGFDSVTECITDGQKVEAFQSYNLDYYRNLRLLTVRT